MAGFIVSLYDNSRQLSAHHYEDYRSNSSSKEIIVKKDPSFNCSGNIVGSCNGLICSVVKTHLDSETRNWVFFDIVVTNPSTGECVNLPKLHMKTCMDTFQDLYMAWGFGHDPACPNEYKVVGISCCPPSMGQVQVYTLGRSNVDGVWRDKGKIGIMLNPNHSLYTGSTSTNGLFLDGCLHWLNYSSKDDEVGILSFDLRDERFVHNFPLLPSVKNVQQQFYELGVGVLLESTSLCVSKQNEKSKKTTMLVFDTNKKLWIKKFKLRWQWPRYQDYRPIAILESVEVLLLSTSIILDTVVLGLYDVDIEKFDHIGNLGDAKVLPKGRQFRRDDLRVRLIPHSKSSVSLKALARNSSMLATCSSA